MKKLWFIIRCFIRQKLLHIYPQFIYPPIIINGYGENDDPLGEMRIYCGDGAEIDFKLMANFTINQCSAIASQRQIRINYMVDSVKIFFDKSVIDLEIGNDPDGVSSFKTQ